MSRQPSARSLPEWTGATQFVNSKTLLEGNIVQWASKYRMGTGQHTEVQEQCKQHMPTKEVPQNLAAAERKESGGGWCARPALNMGKFGERGRRVKKSQQESSLDDRRNLISKIHKSSAEGSSIMGTKGASVKVNIDLLLDRAKLLTFSTKRWHQNGGWTEKKRKVKKRKEKEVSWRSGRTPHA